VLFEVFGVFDSPFDLRDGLKLVWVHHLLPIEHKWDSAATLNVCPFCLEGEMPYSGNLN
jgi:hypothetical protein